MGAVLVAATVPAGAVAGHHDVDTTGRLIVDANLDGILCFPGLTDPRAPADETAAGHPFIFWVNDDQDDRDYFETVPVKKPDLGDERPNSLRDLEDFARLQVDLGQDLSGLAAGHAELVFRWRRDVEAPGVRLFLDADPEGRGRYVTNTEAALAQLEPPFGAALGHVVGAGEVRVALDSLAATVSHGPRLCLLFEGTVEGTGELGAELRFPDGSGRVLQPVHLSIRHVKKLYERMRVEWPFVGLPPWSNISSQPPEPDLTSEPDPMDHPFEQPWYETPDTIVFVVGWTREKREGYMNSLIEALETTYKRLWHRGYRGRFVVFRWDTRKYFMAFGLMESEYRALKSGAPLKDYVDGLTANRTRHVLAHSMGGVVMLEALRRGMEADTALFLQSVVPSEALDPRRELDYPGSEKLVTPDSLEDFGWRGYLSETRTPIYSFFNQQDVAFLGWDSAQRGFKPSKSLTRGYVYYASMEPGDRARLRSFGFHHRPVLDPHEAMAFISRPHTYAIGAEPRIQGVVTDSFDLNARGLEFGVEHGAQFSRNIQKTTDFYNLLLDICNLGYRGVEP